MNIMIHNHFSVTRFFLILETYNVSHCISFDSLKLLVEHFNSVFKNSTSSSESDPFLPETVRPNFTEQCFIAYNSLSNLNDIFKLEGYFLKEISKLESLNGVIHKIQEWVQVNQETGLRHQSFLIDYLDYSIDAYHLNLIVRKQQSSFKIIIDRKSFRNTIKYLEIFNYYYWEIDILNKHKN